MGRDKKRKEKINKNQRKVIEKDKKDEETCGQKKQKTTKANETRCAQPRTFWSLSSVL